LKGGFGPPFLIFVGLCGPEVPIRRTHSRGSANATSALPGPLPFPHGQRPSLVPEAQSAVRLPQSRKSF